MDSVCVNRSELVRRSQSKTCVMEALIRANALNRTGAIDYNTDGVKDGVGFEICR